MSRSGFRKFACSNSLVYWLRGLSDISVGISLCWLGSFYGVCGLVSSSGTLSMSSDTSTLSTLAILSSVSVVTIV